MRAALSAILALAAIFLWWSGGRERELAAAERALVTLQFDEAARRFAALDEGGMLDRVFGRVWPRAEHVEGRRAVVRYWGMPSTGPAAPAASDSAGSSGVRTAGRFLAANAAYREAVAPGGDWRAVVGRLDAVAAQYAEILHEEPGHRDAAFNYEFVVRYRAAVAARQRDVMPAAADDPDVTIHGIEGRPPPGTGMKEFRMLVPMQPDERREAEEAGRGGRRIRKG